MGGEGLQGLILRAAKECLDETIRNLARGMLRGYIPQNEDGFGVCVSIIKTKVRTP